MFIVTRAFKCHEVGDHFNSSFSHLRVTASVYCWIGITNSRDNARNSSFDQAFGARWRGGVVAAWFQRYISCGSKSTFMLTRRVTQRHHFGVWISIAALRVSRTDQLAVFHNRAPHTGARRVPAFAFGSPLQRHFHPFAVVVVIQKKSLTLRCFIFGRCIFLFFNLFLNPLIHLGCQLVSLRCADTPE